VAQLAQTTMRSEIGKLMLDQTFKERDKLNQVRPRDSKKNLKSS